MKLVKFCRNLKGRICQLTLLDMISTENPSTDPLLHIVALEGHITITVALNMSTVKFKIS